MSSNHNLLSKLPSMTVLLQQSDVMELCEKYPESFVQARLRKVLDNVRSDILSGWISAQKGLPEIDFYVCQTEALIKRDLSNRIQFAVNGTGVILHTGLGRAALSSSAQEALSEAAARYSILATNRETGKRGDRNSHNDDLLCDLTGAEASLVVNNNSAAVMLALNTFGEGRESIISRGELVEIGGSFRVPDVMRRSGTVMVEVGTTNRTHLRDYEEAVTDATSVLLKVHPSNYRIEGFHKEVAIRELCDLAKERNLIIIHDIGSGALVDLRQWGLDYEPTVQAALSEGADIVTFSGDKMLGGPQCGIIVGRRDLIEVMKTNPLMRAFRCGKLTLSALNGTLRLFLDPEKLPETHPIYAMIAAPVEIVRSRARKIIRKLKEIENGMAAVEIADGITEMGSGSLPARGIPSSLVVLTPDGLSAEKFSSALRMSDYPLFTRIENDRVVIDARTVADDEISWIVKAVAQVAEVKS